MGIALALRQSQRVYTGLKTNLLASTCALQASSKTIQRCVVRTNCLSDGKLDPSPWQLTNSALACPKSESAFLVLPDWLGPTRSSALKRISSPEATLVYCFCHSMMAALDLKVVRFLNFAEEP